MQIPQPLKTYPLQSAAPVPPAITAPTKCTTNNEKENVKPKSTWVKVPTKTIGKPKPVEEVDLTATTEEDEVVKENSDSVNTGAIVTNAKKRKRKPTVVVSDSVVMEPLVPQVPALDTTYVMFIERFIHFIHFGLMSHEPMSLFFSERHD